MMDQDLKDLESREDAEMIVGSQYASDFANHLFGMAVSMNRARTIDIHDDPEGEQLRAEERADERQRWKDYIEDLANYGRRSS